MRIGHTPQASVKELIRTAERHIAIQEYEIALDKLSRAKQIEPSNTYIQAIIERISALDCMNREMAGDPGQTPDSSEQPYLSVTLGKEIENDVPSRKDVQRRVKRLTGAASQLLERGAYETAFETLMKAYLLDPTSPDVIECEKNLLPTWESMHKQLNTPVRSAIIPQPSVEDGDQRLLALRQQKEQERLEKERAIWREASRPPKILASTEEQQPAAELPVAPTQTGEEESPTFQRGFLAKLRNRKILG